MSWTKADTKRISELFSRGCGMIISEQRAALAEIERLQKEWDDLADSYELRGCCIKQLESERDALRRENERLKKALIDGVPPEVLRGQER